MSDEKTKGKYQVNRPLPAIKRLAEFENYAAYLSMGTPERIAVFGVEKGTDEDFAKKYRISARTLWEWKGRDDFWDKRNEHLKRLRQYTGAVLTSLARKAIKRGDAYEVETFMRLVEGYVPKQKGEVSVEGLAELFKKALGGSHEEDQDQDSL